MTEEVSLTKSELIERMVSAQSRVAGLQLNAKDVDFAVKNYARADV